MTGKATIAVREVTPQNLSRIIDGLRDDEKIEITRVGGVVRVSIAGVVGGQVVVEQVKQRLFTSLNPQPVAPGWMSQVDTPSDAQRARNKEHAKEAKKSADASANLKNMLFASIDMELHSMSIGDATLYHNGSNQYMMFTVGSFSVFTSVTNTRHALMYKEGERGEMKYR